MGSLKTPSDGPGLAVIAGVYVIVMAVWTWATEQSAERAHQRLDLHSAVLFADSVAKRHAGDYVTRGTVTDPATGCVYAADLELQTIRQVPSPEGPHCDRDGARIVPTERGGYGIAFDVSGCVAVVDLAEGVVSWPTHQRCDWRRATL